MQAIWEEQSPVMFARSGDHDYMMRSERRTGRGREGGRPPQRRNRKRKPKRSPFYAVITILLLVLAYPLGLIFLWVRKLRWKPFTKLMVSLLTGVMFFALMAFLLTFQTSNPTITKTQNTVKNSLVHVMDVARDMVTNKEKIEYNLIENGPRIVVDGAQTALMAASRSVPVLQEGIGSIAQETEETAAALMDISEKGVRKVLQQINPDLLPEPEPTPEPQPTPLPEPEPTSTPAPTPAPTSTPAVTQAPQATAQPSPLPQEEIIEEDVPEEEALPQEEDVSEEPEDVEEALPQPEVTPQPKAVSVGVALDPEDIQEEPTPQEEEETPSPEPEEEPEALEVTEPADEPEALEVAEPVDEPETLDIAEPVDEPEALDIAEPVDEPETLEIAEPVDEPEVQEVTQPVDEPEAQEIAEPVDEPEALEIAQPVVEPTAAPIPEPTPEPEPTPVPLPEAEPFSQVSVYYFGASRKYHSGPNCGDMKDAPAHTLEEAAQSGKPACTYCDPPALELLEAGLAVWCDSENVFHISGACQNLTGDWTGRALDQALLDEGMTGCPVCGADLYAEAYMAANPTPAPAPEEVTPE